MALVKITHKGLNILRFAGNIKQFLKFFQHSLASFFNLSHVEGLNKHFEKLN